MVQSIKTRDLTDIDREIEEAVRNRLQVHGPRSAELTPATVRAPSLAMPDYVEHQEGATEIGRLTAEAVVHEYEAAAKEIEAMGAELIGRVKQCEAMIKNAFAVTEELKETAARYREEAKRIFVHIENCSLLTEEVRKTCAELQDRIAASPPAKKGQT